MTPPVSRLSRASRLSFPLLARLPSLALLALIAIYQRTLSPMLPALFGPTCGCRFAPTCSHYAAEAVRVHGAMRGSLLALRRLVKCTPFHPGGSDLVPARNAPQCTRVTSSTLNHSGI
jgi:uncharacterized protein